jgi:hypothetical protein
MLKTLIAGLAGLATAGALMAAPVSAVAGTSRAHASGGSVKVINNCTKAHREPTSYTLTCADANIRITHARYAGWSAAGARGHGRYVYNTCSPSCAAGTFKHHPVRFMLYRPRTVKGHRLFTRMVVQYAGLAEVFPLPTRGV